MDCILVIDVHECYTRVIVLFLAGRPRMNVSHVLQVEFTSKYHSTLWFMFSS